MAKRGIDISEHQGDIDLSALKSQIDFVIIRVGYGVSGIIDKKFKRNADLCMSLGIPIGFYWYSYALDTDGAEKEADAFLNAIAPYTPAYGCWFDMEDADNYKKRHGMPSNDILKAICYKFCEKVEAAGYYTGIYASKSWLDNQLAGDTLSRFDKWVAEWPTKAGRRQKGLDVDANSVSGRSLWQFTSEGVFSGYSGKLDTNYAYKDFPNPRKVAKSAPAASPDSAVTPTPSHKYNIGDRVVINGALYTSSNANSPAGKVSNKVTNITRYAEGAAHPYNTTGDLGWIDENSISLAGNAPASRPIRKGDRVKFTGTESYSGIKLASWVTNGIFDVIEVSGDRIVIGKGTAVTSAVNAKYCERV